MEDTTNITEMATDIVSAYVSQNTLSPEGLPDLIRSVYGTLKELARGKTESPASPENLVPAVSIKKSITPDFLISLEDGKKYKTLKRHLRTSYNLSPEDYRAKWGLPKDYPMVAPAYAANRSALAKSLGLGRKAKQDAPPKSKATPKAG